MPKTNRTPKDKADDRLAASSLVDELRAHRDDVRTALRALPAPASRTAAQKRDALMLRGDLLHTKAILVSWGVGQAADREPTDS